MRSILRTDRARVGQTYNWVLIAHLYTSSDKKNKEIASNLVFIKQINRRKLLKIVVCFQVVSWLQILRCVCGVCMWIIFIVSFGCLFNWIAFTEFWDEAKTVWRKLTIFFLLFVKIPSVHPFLRIRNEEREKSMRTARICNQHPACVCVCVYAWNDPAFDVGLAVNLIFSVCFSASLLACLRAKQYVQGQEMLWTTKKKKNTKRYFYSGRWIRDIKLQSTFASYISFEITNFYYSTFSVVLSFAAFYLQLLDHANVRLI